MNTYKVPQWMCSVVDSLRAEGYNADECRDLADLVMDHAEEIDTQTLKERSGSFIEKLEGGLEGATV